MVKKITENITDYMIIGSSASGIAAAISLRKADEKGRILVLTEEEYSNYSKPLITYYLAGKVSLDDIHFKDKDFFMANNIDLLTSVKVVSVDDGRSQVKTEEGDTIKYGKLLIASGGKPIIPRIKLGSGKSGDPAAESYLDGSNYSEIQGIFTLTTLEDAIRIKNYIEKNEIDSATILGGGLIGLKSAEAFLELGVKINIIELADRILAATFDNQASGIIENAIESRGSRIY